ncbi:MAG TPA: Bax inhibitor-1 family protein [Chroococcales cyanobacterium]
MALLFTLSMLMGGAGAWCGRKIQSFGAVIALGALFLFGTIGVFLAAHASAPVGIGALAIWTFVSGLFVGPAIQAYSEDLGWRTVALAFFGTGGVMAVCGVIGAFSGIDFSAMGTFLMIGLFGIIIAGIIGLFVRWGREANIAISGIACVIFAGYFIFDFFRLSKSTNTWESAIQLAMSIYLDFLNFFLHLLQLLAASKHH